VLTHDRPHVTPNKNEHLTFTFAIDGVESAIAQATAWAKTSLIFRIKKQMTTRRSLSPGVGGAR